MIPNQFYLRFAGLCLTACLFSGIVFAQKCIKKEILSLAKVWKYEKYNVKGTYFEPSESEKADFLNLRADMSFSQVENGEKLIGKWQFNVSTNTIVLHYCKKKETRMYHVEHATDNSLILTYKADWKLEMKLFLKKGLIV